MEQIEQLIAQLEEIFVSAKKSMFSSNDAIVNRNQVLDILARMRINYPEVIKEAQYLVSDCDNQRKKALEYGSRIVEEAEARRDRLLDENEILIQAKEEAEKIRAEAYALHDKSVYEVKVKIDQLLSDSEMTLRDALSLVRSNREDLRNPEKPPMSQPQEAPLENNV